MSISLNSVLGKCDSGADLSTGEMEFLLSIRNPEDLRKLYAKAYEIKISNVGAKVFFRGLIELSNICEKDCNYCGIRRSNTKVDRFLMTAEEIVQEAKFAFENHYGSIVLQSGERTDRFFVDFIGEMIREIKRISDGRLGMTLCLGEQDEETYRKWFDAGAHRYLLRIETSSPELYRSLHPKSHSFERRLECIGLLKRVGYQVGTGVMIGLPGQTLGDLAKDIVFFRDNDIDMIGMGPFIPHEDTPLSAESSRLDKKEQLELGLKMIAVARIFLKDVNIASTTALQALNPTGRELGLLAGANIIMPSLTETKYRRSYRLYDGKPCLDENSSMCKGCLQKRIEGIGETIGFDEWGDSPHFRNKTARKS